MFSYTIENTGAYQGINRDTELVLRSKITNDVHLRTRAPVKRERRRLGRYVRQGHIPKAEYTLCEFISTRSAMGGE